MGNQFDNMIVDFEAKHKELNEPGTIIATRKYQRGFIRRYVDKVLFYFGWYERLVDAGLIRGWFYEFEEYWRNSLGGRPFRFHDFHFLRNTYRRKFQEGIINEGSSKEEYMKAYQDPSLLYSTFGAVYKYALNPWHYWKVYKFLKRGDRILEYGCGIAPITAGLINDGLDHFDFTIADIRAASYHYAKFRLKQFGVKMIDLDPEDMPKLDEYDVVFCVTVLEHLQYPLRVVQHLTEHIAPGGYFVFDYYFSDASGFDTQEAIDQRGAVLNYIASKYDIVHGSLDYEKTMLRTVGKKKT